MPVDELPLITTLFPAIRPALIKRLLEEGAMKSYAALTSLSHNLRDQHAKPECRDLMQHLIDDLDGFETPTRKYFLRTLESFNYGETEIAAALAIMRHWARLE